MSPLPSLKVLKRLLYLVQSENPQLLPAFRWIALGPELAEIALNGSEPSADDLAAILRLLQEKARDLLPLGRELMRDSTHGEAAELQLCVDQLLEHSNWEHPTEVLDRPRPDLGKLLAACQTRLKRSRGKKRAQVEAMVAKVERAVRIAEIARKRRERMLKKQRRR